MATTCESTSVAAAPWRRSKSDQIKSRSLSGDGKEFVTPISSPVHQAARHLDTSDDDNLQSEMLPPCQVPAAVSSHPWRRAIPKETESSLAGGSEENAKVRPWRRPKEAEPNISSREAWETALSSKSTSGDGSPRLESESADVSDSIAMESCRSRSQSPVNLAPDAVEDAAQETWYLSPLMMLKWRQVSELERPEGQLTTAMKAEDVSDEELSPHSLNGRRYFAEGASQPQRHRRHSTGNIPKLEVSQDSWTARQRARRDGRGTDDMMSDEDVARTMKSLLNKLTVERFDTLSVQLIRCGMHSAQLVEVLIHEVFEKATTQHHFVRMYTDLCELLNGSLVDVLESSNTTFKKILLNCCQASFEKNLKPPAGIENLEGEERRDAEIMYKMRMIGNVQFVGELAVRRMLAVKVVLSITQQLLEEATAESLESLAAFLNVVGPTFDIVTFTHSVTLNAVFKQVATLSNDKSIPSRIRCLLKDVLDNRETGWKDKKPKRIDGPLKLDQVAAKAAAESKGGCFREGRRRST